MDKLHTPDLNKHLNGFVICLECLDNNSLDICEIVAPESSPTNVIQHLMIHHKSLYSAFLDKTKVNVFNYDPKNDRKITLVEMIASTCQPLNFVGNHFD